MGLKNYQVHPLNMNSILTHIMTKGLLQFMPITQDNIFTCIKCKCFRQVFSDPWRLYLIKVLYVEVRIDISLKLLTKPMREHLT